MPDLPSRAGYTVTFLRIAAGELHKLAEDTPELARELRYMADQLHGEADDLAGYIRE